VSRLGAIGIGTNSVRLLVAEFPSRAPRPVPVLRRSQITRLGERLTPEGRIRTTAAVRTAKAVSKFVALAAAEGVATPVLVGTYALRAAQNPGELLTRVKLPVRILTGDEEARLGYRGVLAGLGPLRSTSRLLVADIGGGSVELTWGSRGRIERSVSLPAGAVVLTERFLAHDPPLVTEIAALREHLVRAFEPIFARRSARPLRLVGVGGTITTMAAIDQQLSPYDPDRVHGFKLSRRAIDRITANLLARTVAERRHLPGLQPGRGDIIAAGALVLQHLMARSGVRFITVGEADLLWGLLLEARTDLGTGSNA
jgi:exopolyphosphatase/guanosine-5'-triphosphate,3'-diphosphate pyrophosphatase